MENEMNINQEASVSVTRVRKLLQAMLFHNPVYVEHVRNGKVIATYETTNGITNAGMNALLGIMFHGVTQITTWYASLINNSGFTALADADTMASHTGWTEWTNYDETDRVEWDEDAASGRAITNSTPMEFTMSASGTLKGLLVVSDDTKGGTTGTLWATAAFGSTVTVNTDDVLRITYAVSG
jgi:hypothetical protein